MHPVVQATTRIPGPSTAEPVVKEWRKPMSPEASADRTSVSGMFLPRLTRSSYGLAAASGVALGASSADIGLGSVERPVDDVHLLLAGQAHEIDRVAGDANRQARILIGVLHRIHEHLAVEHVDVHVEAGRAE